MLRKALNANPAILNLTSKLVVSMKNLNPTLRSDLKTGVSRGKTERQEEDRSKLGVVMELLLFKEGVNCHLSLFPDVRACFGVYSHR